MTRTSLFVFLALSAAALVTAARTGYGDNPPPPPPPVTTLPPEPTTTACPEIPPPEDCLDPIPDEVDGCVVDWACPDVFTTAADAMPVEPSGYNNEKTAKPPPPPPPPKEPTDGYGGEDKPPLPPPDEVPVETTTAFVDVAPLTDYPEYNPLGDVTTAFPDYPETDASIPDYPDYPATDAPAPNYPDYPATDAPAPDYPDFPSTTAFPEYEPVTDYYPIDPVDLTDYPSYPEPTTAAPYKNRRISARNKKTVKKARGQSAKAIGSLKNLSPPVRGNDADVRCCFWAKMNECDTNQFYMRPWCQKSCGTTGCTVAKAHTCRVRLDVVDCPWTDVDITKFRRSLKQKRNRANKKARVSFKAAKAKQPSRSRAKQAKDTHELCAFWASIGECERKVKRKTMWTHCRQACLLRRKRVL